jgi:hypothetical protein
MEVFNSIKLILENIIELLSLLCFREFLFSTILVFELRAVCLLSNNSATQATPNLIAFNLLVIQIGFYTNFAQLALIHDSPYLRLLSSWDYRLVPHALLVFELGSC